MIQVAGNYRARCSGEDAVDFAINSNGNEQMLIGFVLLDDDDNPTADHITWFGNLGTSQGQEIAFKAMKACGHRGTSFTDTTGMCDQIVTLVIEQDADFETKDLKFDDNGNPVWRVKWVNKSGGLKFKNSLDESGRVAFNNKMQGAFLALSKKHGGPPANGKSQGNRRPNGRPSGSSYSDDLPPEAYADD